MLDLNPELSVFLWHISLNSATRQRSKNIKEKGNEAAHLNHHDGVGGAGLQLGVGHEILMREHQGALQVIDVRQAAIDGGLHEPDALAGALHPGVAPLWLHDAAGERVVRHQRLGQSLPYHLGRLLAVLEDV